MKKSPYSFPLRSRAAMVEFLTRDGRSYDWTRYRFAWNVKACLADFDGDSLRGHDPSLDSALDSAWAEHLERDSDAFWRWCEDAGRYLSEDEWTSYPGDDQGDWKFAFAGRSGGWLVLTEWRGRNMRDFDPEEMLDAEEWPFADLRAFYRGIVCADQDFTSAAASGEVEYQAAFDRGTWEEDMRAEREQEAAALAAEMAASRPDLAPAYA